MILGVEDILISWFVIILALLGVASLFVCCMIHCKHLRLSDANKLAYLLTYLTSFRSQMLAHPTNCVSWWGEEVIAVGLYSIILQ